MTSSSREHLTIGSTARRAGVGVDTIRYYEREGLLPTPRRRASGYRDYDAATVLRLRFIRRAKALGFSLDDIRGLLALSADRDRGVAAVRARAESRLLDVEHRIRELQRIRRGLKELVDACPGRGEPGQCPILRALSDREAS